MQAKYLVLCCCNRDSLKFDMQHDHVLKKLNFNLLTPFPVSGKRDMQAKYLVLCCCNRDSLKFDMQRDHDSGILTYWPHPKGQVCVCVCVWGGGSAGKIFATMFLYFVIPFNLICNMTIF